MLQIQSLDKEVPSFFDFLGLMWPDNKIIWSLLGFSYLNLTSVVQKHKTNSFMSISFIFNMWGKVNPLIQQLIWSPLVERTCSLFCVFLSVSHILVEECRPTSLQYCFIYFLKSSLKVPTQLFNQDFYWMIETFFIVFCSQSSVDFMVKTMIACYKNLYPSSILNSLYEVFVLICCVWT